MIELILLERVEKLGQMGQLVKVKPGYARNYLLPQKKAMRATKENLTYFETQRAQLEANNLQRRTEATEVGGKVEGLSWYLELFTLPITEGHRLRAPLLTSLLLLAQVASVAGFFSDRLNEGPVPSRPAPEQNMADRVLG